MKAFTEWFRNYLKCDWEDYEGNLGESDMERAFQAGREYEAKLCAGVVVNKI